MDAVAGGTSVRRAIGSARSVCEPSGRLMSNLYSAPSPTPGRNSSHTPVRAERAHRVGRAVPVVEVPVTRTPRAFGAQTVKRVPVTPWWVMGSAPSAFHSSSCRPSPIRCRSRSPSAGRNRYGSSVSCTCPSYAMTSRYSGTPRSGSTPEKKPSPSSCSSARSPSASTVTDWAYGRSTRKATPPGSGCAPRTPCGSWCVAGQQPLAVGVVQRGRGKENGLLRNGLSRLRGQPCRPALTGSVGHRPVGSRLAPRSGVAARSRFCGSTAARFGRRLRRWLGHGLRHCHRRGRRCGRRFCSGLDHRPRLRRLRRPLRIRCRFWRVHRRRLQVPCCLRCRLLCRPRFRLLCRLLGQFLRRPLCRLLPGVLLGGRLLLRVLRAAGRGVRGHGRGPLRR